MSIERGDGARQNAGYQSGLFVFTDSQFVLLRDLILERTGMMFDDAKRGLLSDKLSELVAANALTSFLDYYYLLRYDAAADSHWAALLDRLSVPETYFWRQADQIRAVSEVVAPSHFAINPGKRLTIWCAACCTGEEPLSIAIALAEAGLLDTGLVDICATDGSNEMVARARIGQYGERSFRQLPANLREKYFEPHGALWRPIERVRTAVRYGVVNLVKKEEVAPYAKADVIFCRNVFIYFSDAVIKRVVQSFIEQMAPDGCLFLGAAESLTRLGVELDLTEVGGAFAYVRPGNRPYSERPPTNVPIAPAARRLQDGSWQG
jgi:chemotaxis protein methyltransferase CheR